LHIIFNLSEKNRCRT